MEEFFCNKGKKFVFVKELREGRESGVSEIFYGRVVFVKIVGCGDMKFGRYEWEDGDIWVMEIVGSKSFSNGSFF